MPIPEQRDFEATRKILAEWLRDKVGEVEVSQLVIPDGTGYSNETLLFDAGVWYWRGEGKASFARSRPAASR